MNATTTATEAPAATRTAAGKKPARKPGKGKGRKPAAPPPPANNRGTPAVGPVAKPTTCTVKGVAVRVEPTANGNRYTVAGVGLCPFLRWCGAAGYTPRQVKLVLAVLGLGATVSPSTVGCQVGSAAAEKRGKVPHHPGSVPTLPGAELKAVKALFAAV